MGKPKKLDEIRHKLIETKGEWKAYKKFVEMNGESVAPAEDSEDNGWGNGWDTYSQKHRYNGANASPNFSNDMVEKMLSILGEFSDVIGELSGEIEKIKEEAENLINEKTSNVEEEVNKKVEEFKKGNEELEESLSDKFGHVLTETLKEVKTLTEELGSVKKENEELKKELEDATVPAESRIDVIEAEFNNLKQKFLNFLELLALKEDLSLQGESDFDIETPEEGEETPETAETSENIATEEMPNETESEEIVDEEKVKEHFGLSDEEWDALSEEEKKDYIDRYKAETEGNEEETPEKLNEENPEVTPPEEVEVNPNEPTVGEEVTTPEVKSERDLFNAMSDLFNNTVNNNEISGEVHRVPEPQE